MNKTRGFIEDLLEASDRIAQFNRGKSRETFLADRLTQDATIRNLEILGEASRQLRDALPDAYDRFPQIPFRKDVRTPE